MNTTSQTIGAIRSFTHTAREVILKSDQAQVAITFISEDIINVRLAPQGTFRPPRSWSPWKLPESFPEVVFNLDHQEDSLSLVTGKLSVSVNLPAGGILFKTPAGHPFCSDAAGFCWSLSDTGVESQTCIKSIDPEEHFFGFGERSGLLDKRGHRMVNWTTDPPHGHNPGTDPMYIAIPIFISLKPGLAYGFSLNNTFYSELDMGATNPAQWSMHVAGGELNYTVFYGLNPSDVMRKITQVYGRMPMPPRWSLGYHQSRWGYETEDIVRKVADRFRTRHIPCDVIHLDIDYMNAYRVFTWHPRHFPNPASLIQDLNENGFRAVTITDPGVKVDPQYSVYCSGLEKRTFIEDQNGQPVEGFVWPDRSVFPDFSQPKTRLWWGEQQKKLTKMGISGIWNDMNEPTLFSAPFSTGISRAHTIDIDIPQGPEGERTTHAELHNLYGSMMAQASYEGMRHWMPEQRPFVLTRSAFSGIQRWSACWMGDNHAWWEHLEMSMPQLLNMGISGVPFVGADIGGFADNASPELFIRWMQLGSLYPFCRGHSAHNTIRCEPWCFGEEAENSVRKSLLLRYRLLPYIYSLFWESSQTGAPILRPLYYHFPNDNQTYQLHDQLMLGPFLMAAPVYQPGRRARSVYLPNGNWFDFWTGQKFNGSRTILTQAPLDHLPLFVREGAIVPQGPEIEYTQQKTHGQIEFFFYPGNGEFTLYEDDGISYLYQNGEYALRELAITRSDETHYRVHVSSQKGSYQPPAKEWLMILTGFPRGTRWEDGEAWANHGKILRVKATLGGMDFSIRLPRAKISSS